MADVHGSVIKGLEQLLAPFVGQPCFRLKFFCGYTQLTQDTTLKLPLELQVAVGDYVAVEAIDVDELTDASQRNDAAAVEAFPAASPTPRFSGFRWLDSAASGCRKWGAPKREAARVREC